MGHTDDKRLMIYLSGIIVALLLFVVFIDKIFPTPYIDEKYLSEYQNISFNVDEGNNPGANVTIIEILDFRCPFCKEMHANIMKLSYEYDINIIFKHFPVKEGSLADSVASECARDQGKFSEYANFLFRTPHEGKMYLDTAELLGMDIAVFEDCLRFGNKTEIVEKDSYEAISYGIQGTPTIIVNGQKIEGLIPYDRLEMLIGGYYD